MDTLQLASLLAVTAALFGWVSVRWLRMPITIGTMLLTVIASVGLELASARHPGLHTWALRLVQQLDFEALILHFLLALLLFAGAFMLDLKGLFEQRLVVATLAIAGTVLTAGAVAALMFFVLNAIALPVDWLACLIFGALISPTDPIAVLEMLRRVGISSRLQAQLAGESLFNDGIGAVLFLTMLEVARGGSPSVGHIAGFLLLEVGGATVLGIGAAWLTSWLMSRILAYQVDLLLTVALALGGYALAEILHLSAPLEAVIAGIALRYFNARHPRQRIAHDSVDRFWEVVDELQNAVLFVLLGIEVLAIPIARAGIESGAVAVVVVLAVRFGVVALLLWLLRCCGQRFTSSVAVLGWGGLHGGLSLALVLSLAPGPATKWLLPATYSVVLFSVLVQGGSMPLMLRRFGGRHVDTAEVQTLA